MTLATTFSRAAVGIDALLVTIEVHLGNGLPAFHIVGLPEKAVQESRERIRSALINTGFEFPARRITVNLAPADLPKQGSRFDLGIAVGILIASGQLQSEVISDYEFIGELTLSGQIRPVPGSLPVALACSSSGRSLVLPSANLTEAGLVRDAMLFGAQHLIALHSHLAGEKPIDPAVPPSLVDTLESAPPPDLDEVVGQHRAKRALEVAAAGQHNLLFSGPPGAGKSMLASRLPGIMPNMTEQEALESAAVCSISGRSLTLQQWKVRPFRTPHHTASAVALVGGGSPPKPGEISLAHHGVLFLDELPEYARQVLEVLREPLETGHISISRAAQQAEFPARFQLVAAMNPCPCGYLGDPDHACRCTPDQVNRYQSRISGPLWDRIDLHVQVPAMKPTELIQDDNKAEPSALVQKRVMKAFQSAISRQGHSNAQLGNQQIKAHCSLDSEGEALMAQALQRLKLSARGYHRVLRVARTIADLDDSTVIDIKHLTEAMSYRSG
ncbi:MAG: YifB family Mg chelatase-like AAA ATPase [bacterium]